MANSYLRRYLSHRPMHLSILRAAECQLYEAATLERPILDVGCGDGFFASVAFEEALDGGIDLSAAALAEAQRSGSYRHLELASSCALPFPDGSFGTVISNSVLEHIPDLDGSLTEIARVLRPGGMFLFTTPNGDYVERLLGTRLLRAIRLHALAEIYARYMTLISRHYHYYSSGTWVEKLAGAGFRVVDRRPYFSNGAVAVFDLTHFLGYPSFVWKLLFGRWVLIPGRTAFLPLENWLRPFTEPDGREIGGYLFFACQRASR